MSSKQTGRRRFLKDSALLAGLAVGAVQSAGTQTPGGAGNRKQAPSLNS